MQDACSFAFLQLLRYQPSRGSVFSWLLTVAVRDAVKLDQRDRRDRRLPARENGGELEPVDERADPELRLQTLAALEAIAAAGLSRPAGTDRGTTRSRAHIRVDQRDVGAERTDRGAAAVARTAQAPLRARRPRGARTGPSQALTW